MPGSLGVVVAHRGSCPCPLNHLLGGLPRSCERVSVWIYTDLDLAPVSVTLGPHLIREVSIEQHPVELWSGPHAAYALHILRHYRCLSPRLLFVPTDMLRERAEDALMMALGLAGLGEGATADICCDPRLHHPRWPGPGALRACRAVPPGPAGAGEPEVRLGEWVERHLGAARARLLGTWEQYPVNDSDALATLAAGVRRLTEREWAALHRRLVARPAEGACLRLVWAALCLG